MDTINGMHTILKIKHLHTLSTMLSITYAHNGPVTIMMYGIPKMEKKIIRYLTNSYINLNKSIRPEE
jgi:hypothetical protein